MKKWILLAAMLVFSGCAARQNVVFNHFQQMDEAQKKQIEEGRYEVSADKLFAALGKVLDHDPWLYWDYDVVDRMNLWYKLDAGFWRKVNFRITPDGENASRLNISIPRRVLKGAAAVYVFHSEENSATAYEPEGIQGFEKVKADFKLDELYYHEAVYRYLNNMDEVPFTLTKDDVSLPKEEK